MLEKIYQPASVEPKWTRAWREAGLFKAEPSGDPRRAYTIVIPPPNVTGALHIGHALNDTLQDILIRYHRLAGRQVCWVPGTDHGGIATQNVMEKILKGERLSRHQVGRGQFLERMREWTLKCKATILGQLERLGCALDGSREAFTMDEPRARAVGRAFESLWREGLIYRGERMVNWCVRCDTALSDAETEPEDRKGTLWHLRYPVKGEPGRSVVVATTRPETLLGDTAVAVHPDDDRYRGLIGRTLVLPLLGRDIPVVADSHVDPRFGTGAVKVTPAHDPNDFEIWQRHKGEMGGPLVVIDRHGGRMTELAGPAYAGSGRDEARKKVVEDLKGQGLLEKEEVHLHTVKVCYRCSQVIEPLVSEQWFMRMGPLAAKASAALAAGDFRILPESWEGPYRVWLEGIRDWCLSRQIWWGHRIPVWYCGRCLGGRLFAYWPEAAPMDSEAARGAVYPVARLLADGIPVADIEARCRYLYAEGILAEGGEVPPGLAVGQARPGPCPACGKEDWVQDPDVLDTWFSSSLWPLSVFGWPEETKDLRFFYPTSVLVTGYEILYLWVARMQMMGLHLRPGSPPPFGDCLIHGIVRDKAGKKMSKSLGNVIDPLVMMDAHGTDAFRFSLAMQAHPGKDIPYAEDSIKGPRNFANKLWNSTRFVLLNLPEKAPPGGYPLAALDRAGLELADRWILAEFEAMAARFHARMGEYAVAAAADEVYGFLWDRFCDWYVELAKLRLGEEAGVAEGPRLAARTVLVQVLTGTLKLLHPFMPFITEELYSALKPYAGESAGFLAGAGFAAASGWADADACRRMDFLMESVRALRALRAQLNVPPALKIRAQQAGGGNGELEVLRSHAEYVRHLARLEALEPASSSGRPPQSGTAVAGAVTFYVPLAGLIDLDKERSRLGKEVSRLAEDMARCEAQLADQAFAARAPAAEIAKLQRRLAEARTKHASLADTLRGLH